MNPEFILLFIYVIGIVISFVLGCLYNRWTKTGYSSSLILIAATWPAMGIVLTLLLINYIGIAITGSKAEEYDAW